MPVNGFVVCDCSTNCSSPTSVRGVDISSTGVSEEFKANLTFEVTCLEEGLSWNALPVSE